MIGRLARQMQRRQAQEKEQPIQKPTIKLKQWLNGFKGTNSQFLKKNILNFFISQGLYDVSKVFAEEAGVKMPQVDEEQVRARYKIKKCIEEGKIDQGLQQITKIKKKKIKINQNIKQQRQQNIKENKSKQKSNQNIPIQIIQNIQKQIQQQQNSNNQIIDLDIEPLSQRQLLLTKQSKIQEVIKQNDKKQQQINKQKFIKLKEKQEIIQEIIIEENYQEIFSKNNNKQLLFALKCLKVIDLIKSNKIQQSIKVAKQQLLPYAKLTNKEQTDNKNKNQSKDKEQDQYMEKIEKVMSLIAFINTKECPNYQLTTFQYRMKIASQLNCLLLEKANYTEGQALSALIKLTKWCQKRLEKYVNVPKINVGASNYNIFTSSP